MIAPKASGIACIQYVTTTPRTMTDRQIKSVRTKIDSIKKALAADKRKWGGQYRDGRGLRYLSPQYYLKLQDYSGALKYFNWFHKNFPDDSGHPNFLFEWAITLFYCDKIEDAEKKAFQTYFRNTYYFDKFFDKKITPLDKWEGSNWEHAEMALDLIYSCKQNALADFSNWLQAFINSDRFIQTSKSFLYLMQQLKNTPVGQKRTELVRRLSLVE